jgi:hypothetical protein
MPRKSALTQDREAAPTLTEISAPPSLPPILTLAETARELRCSKAHLHNIIAGKVRDLPPLPVLRLGRRLLVRAAALTQWMLSLESREVEGQRLTGLFGR